MMRLEREYLVINNGESGNSDAAERRIKAKKRLLATRVVQWVDVVG